MASDQNDVEINFVEEPFPDLTFSDIDCKDPIFSSESFLLNDCIDHSNISDLNNIAPTPDGSMPSHSINLSSPPQLVLGFDNPLLIDLANVFNDDSFGYSSTTIDPFHDIPDTAVPEIRLNGHEPDVLQIIAQPNPSYRPRYESEVNPAKGRANRFIGAAKDNDKRYEYPTVRIPSWCHPNQRLYIRVSLLTITSDNIHEHYIHPYTIRTSDQNAIKDPVNNSLYFRINETEYQTREKSFTIMILKKRQDQIQTSEPMRLFEHETCVNISIAGSCDARQMIKQYQLWKSRFVFTVVEKKDGRNEFLFYSPMVMSDIMAEEDDPKSNSPRSRLNSTSTDEIRCIPRKSDWLGGEEIVIIMPNPIKKKKYDICFDFGEHGIQTVELDIIEPRTIVFRTPPCPVPVGEDNLRIPILIHENQTPLTTIDFHYIPPIKPMSNKRLLAHDEDMNGRIDYKRLKDFTKTDSAECLVKQIDQLSLNKIDTKPRSNSTSMSERLNNLNERLGQVKTALEIFVRTNNPSKLFHTVGFLLSKYEGSSPPLHDAIQNGHIKIALVVIDQTMDLPPSKNLLIKENEDGETPLLLAAKFNQWKIIELILKNRPELGKQKDKSGNNLFHFLAKLSEDGGAKTIEDVFQILPEELKIDLLREENKQNQTPMNIAQLNGSNFCSKLLNNHENKSE